MDGTIVHNPDDNVIAFHRSGVTLANAVFEARFFNPYPVTEGTWSSGFIFRQFGGNELSAVFVRGSGQWYQYLRTGDAETSQQLRRESSADIDTSPSGSNHLRVIALEKTGWLFINGKLAGELDLSMWDKAGDIRAIGSWFAGDEIAEKATLFEDFSVRALVRTFGPTDGTIAHNPNDNSIAVRNSSGTLANAVFEARFHNPYPTTEGSWNSGFLFRNPKFNEYHAVVLKGNGNWIHYLSTGDVGTQQQLRSEQSVDIDTSPDGSNHIRVIALEDEGWLFINGNLAGELDLSMWGEAGGVRALGSFFRSSEIAGKATSFEDFNVWSVGQ